MRALFACTAVTALACAAPCASAQVFKWVDEYGVVNYGDWPPWGAKLQDLNHGTVTVVAGASKRQTGEPRARDEQRTKPSSGSTPAPSDDVQYSGAYAADYGFPARRVHRAEARIDRPLPEQQPVAEPKPAVHLPAVAEMPRPVRR